MRKYIQYGSKGKKFTNIWKLNYIFLNNQRIKEEITREF